MKRVGSSGAALAAQLCPVSRVGGKLALAAALV